MKKYFEPSRFLLLLKMEIYRSRKGLLMTTVIIFGFLFFVGLLLSTAVEQGKIVHEHASGYAFTLIIGGFILSSLAFNDLSNHLKSYHYFTLPVSALEKFLCMWLLTSVGWVVLFTLTYTFYTLIANQIGHLLFSLVTFQTFNPLGEIPVLTMKYYVVLHGIFLVGAAQFKGYVLPKIFFTLILFATVLSTLAYFIIGDVMTPDAEEYLSESHALDGMPVYQLWLIIKWLFWWVLAPLCWVITYFGLKEQEV